MLVLFFMLLDFSPAEERGITGTPPQMEIVGDLTDEVTTGRITRPKRGRVFSPKKSSAEWALIDSCSFYGRIQAGGKYFAKIDGILHPTFPDNLTSTAADAVEDAPEWLRTALWDNFSRMTTSCQNTYGNLILSTPSPCKDEVAFQVAHIDPGILAHHSSNTQIFVENAELVYQYDTLLDYVELVEYSDYTTTKYKIADHGDTSEFEISKEMYYWSIVHPIIQKEAPLYIDPRKADASHTGAGEAAPPTGKFWRDYIFTYPDTAEKRVSNTSGTDVIDVGFVSPILKEELAGEKILWDGKRDTIPDNGAIGIITKWAQDVMVFNSGSERPWQAVRIYHMHIGRCGEFGDIVAAAARAALIPTNRIGAYRNDHIWNEWYDTEWHHWEPVNTMINAPDRYDPGWWELSTCFSTRGDGYLWDVVERYTPHCTLTVTVNDASGNPVDGAKVTVGTKSGSSCYGGTWHNTNSDGMVDFILGDKVTYCAWVTSAIGNSPSAYTVITNSAAGTHYNWSVPNLPGNMPTLSVTQDSMADTTQLYKVEIDFGVPNEIVYGQTYFVNEVGVAQKFGKWIDFAQNIDFFICDSANFALYDGGSSFEAFEIGTDVDSGNVSFVFPQNKWYVVLSNDDNVDNSEVVDVKVRLFKNQAGAEEAQKKEFKFEISPSPFSSFASIDFMMPQKAKVDLGVYDLAGRCVKQIFKEKTVFGHHRINLDGRELGKGVYFIRLVTPDRTITEKIIRL